VSAPGREAAWTVGAIFAVEAADESEARDIGNQVLRQMDATLRRAAGQSREQV